MNKFLHLPLAALLLSPLAVLSVRAGTIATNCLNDSPDCPWKIRRWDERYPFIFLSYAGDWNNTKYQRVAQECKEQRLLTPTWQDPAFHHPVESKATEWGHREKPEGATRRECYEWMKKAYMDMIAPAVKARKPFYSLTSQSFFSVYGALWGCDMVGLEPGQNCNAMQAKMAFLRGGARQNGKPMYVQPSQWYRGTTPIYMAGVDDTFAHSFDKVAALKIYNEQKRLRTLNGGHSASLLSRMWYAAWLSGAAVVCPEACQENFFCGDEKENAKSPPDQRIPLSPLGRRAQKFVELTEKHPDRGIPYTPFALLLDQYCGFNGFQLTQPRPWNVMTPHLEDREISLFLDTIFPKSMMLDLITGMDDEPEERRLVRSPYGDTFDVLLSNTRQDLLNGYPAVICLGEHEFLPETVEILRSYLAAGGRLFLTHAHAAQLGERLDNLKRAGRLELFGLTQAEIPPQVDVKRWFTTPYWGTNAVIRAARKQGLELLPYEKHFVAEATRLMDGLCEEYLPVRVTGDVEFTLNWRSTGWIVGLINNEGVTKGPLTPVMIDNSKTQTVTIKLKQGPLRSAHEWCANKDLPVSEDSATLTVPPGEVRIAELVSK